MSYLPIKEAAYSLKIHYNSADEVEKIVIQSALVGAGADAVASIVPGVAIPATIVACFGTVWVMYGRIASTLGIQLKENVLKLVARAALANIGANLGGALIAAFVGMFIPGFSIFASAAVAFVTVYLAGLIFLRLLAKLADKSKDPYTFSDISDATFQTAAESTVVDKEDLMAAKAAQKANKK